MERQNYVSKKFATAFGSVAENIFTSSGRIEILGNHTDHNNGVVLVGAIDLNIVAAVNASANAIKIYQDNFAPIEMNVATLMQTKYNIGTSQALIQGIFSQLSNRGYKLGGFVTYMDSTIFKGAGVSSSAAFECLVVEIFNQLYCNNEISKLERAIISQYAEVNYFGKPCGLLDQCGISFGGVNMIDFEQPTKPVVSTIVPNLKDFSIVITNTGGDHSNLTSHYSAIRNEMNSVASFFNADVLRQVDYNEFVSSVDKVRTKTGERAVLRAIHFFDESKRAKLGYEALRTNDIDAFLKCVNDSGDSSHKYLQNCYVPNASQEVTYGVAMSKIFNPYGATRVHGGGFAGTIISFVPNSQTDEYLSSMKKLFGNDNVTKVSIVSQGVTHQSI